MARVPLSKSQLSKEKESLASYRRYLPALDLKRQQLMGERLRARREIGAIRERIEAVVATAGEAIPMLADRRVNLEGLVRLEAVEYGTQNVAGVRLPTVERIKVVRAPYGRMVRPHWVDAVAERLVEAIRLRVEERIAEERLALLDVAVTRITQRVNLFEKVLIPQTQENIRRINVYLGDTERAAVVGAKIAKKKREAQLAAEAAARAAAAAAA
jgi:V/A-type H+/Na+-transporting ATPase subunit D